MYEKEEGSGKNSKPCIPGDENDNMVVCFAGLFSLIIHRFYCQKIWSWEKWEWKCRGRKGASVSRGVIRVYECAIWYSGPVARSLKRMDLCWMCLECTSHCSSPPPNCYPGLNLNVQSQPGRLERGGFASAHFDVCPILRFCVFCKYRMPSCFTFAVTSWQRRADYDTGWLSHKLAPFFSSFFSTCKLKSHLFGRTSSVISKQWGISTGVEGVILSETEMLSTKSNSYHFKEC